MQSPAEGIRGTMELRTLSVLVALGLASVSVSIGQDASSEPHPWLREEAVQRGLDFRHVSGHDGRFLFPEIHAGGAALFDADQDGDLDAYLVQSGSLIDAPSQELGNQLYLNRGNGEFRNASRASGADDSGYGMGVASGDFDNDGNVDLYVTNVGPNVLLRNLGRGRFQDVTAQAGVGVGGWSASAIFFDYDLDGDLDLFVTNYLNWTVDREVECFDKAGRLNYCGPAKYDTPAADFLFRNDGGGRFSDATVNAKMDVTFGTGLGVGTGDFDDNGWPDLFVANDGMLDQLWLNQGDGTFRDEAVFRGCAADLSGQPKAGMGVTAADVDNDGDLDLAVCNLGGETDSVFLNQGDYFSDHTGASGLASISRSLTRFGMAWIDFDNDGYLDIYQSAGAITTHGRIYLETDPYAEPNLLLRGLPGPEYREVLPRGGTRELLVATSRAAAFGDVDGDGGIDILVVNRDAPVYLLMNQVAVRGNWLRVAVTNDSGSPALGAVVVASVGDARLRREVHSAFSYQAANDPAAHFGLGEVERVDGLAVRWPDGRERCTGPQEANQILEVKGSDGVECPTAKRIPDTADSPSRR